MANNWRPTLLVLFGGFWSMQCPKGGVRPAGRNSFDSKGCDVWGGNIFAGCKAVIMEGTGDRKTGEVNLDRLRPRGVKRRLAEGDSEASVDGERIRRKRQRGQQEEVEDDEDGREEMERLVGLVPSLMGRAGSVSQVRKDRHH